MADCDAGEAQARRDAHAKNIGLVSQLAVWIDATPPLVDWGWSEHTPSCWLPSPDGKSKRERVSSMALAQFAARVRKLVTMRMEVAQLPGLYEYTYGERIDMKSLGNPSLREALAAIPGVQLCASHRWHHAHSGRSQWLPGAAPWQPTDLFLPPCLPLS